MNMSELRNLDINNIGSWPALFKAVVILLVCGLVAFGGWYFDTQGQLSTLDADQKHEKELKIAFETKQRKAANLEPLKEQLAEMKQSFGAMLRLLPNRTEIPGLLVDISQAGLASGLEFELFKPLPEKPAEFYAIQPIRIRVTGTYHQFGEFVSAVAALPRIVTEHDINISVLQVSDQQKKAVAEKNESPDLVMDMTARTYRYLEDDEMQSKKGK